MLGLQLPCIVNDHLQLTLTPQVCSGPALRCTYSSSCALSQHSCSSALHAAAAGLDKCGSGGVLSDSPRVVVPAGETQSEGGFKSGKVSSAALLDVQVTAGLLTCCSADPLGTGPTHSSRSAAIASQPASLMHHSHICCAGKSYGAMQIVQEANDKSGKPYYKYEILTRTGAAFPGPGSSYDIVRAFVCCHLSAAAALSLR